MLGWVNLGCACSACGISTSLPVHFTRRYSFSLLIEEVLWAWRVFVAQ